MKWLSDQMQRTLTVENTPQRVISLVPSVTEYLLDLDVEVVGRTKFCIHPAEKVKEIPIIGGTKKFRFEEIRALNPDLIIGNKEENYKTGIETLEREFSIWMSDIATIDQGIEMMQALGSVLNREKKSEQLIGQIRNRFDQFFHTKKGEVVYFIWQNPWMAAGRGTYIHEMLSHLGYKNLIEDSRYPEMSEEDLMTIDPEIVLLSSEPFPFKEKHVEKLSQLLPKAEIRLVNGEFYSWYGTRVLKTEP
jgi:ABC-type Fe3+-hydroxamate transport system substrate-binding protein